MAAATGTPALTGDLDFTVMVEEDPALTGDVFLTGDLNSRMGFSFFMSCMGKRGVPSLALRTFTGVLFIFLMTARTDGGTFLSDGFFTAFLYVF